MVRGRRPHAVQKYAGARRSHPTNIRRYPQRTGSDGTDGSFASFLQSIRRHADPGRSLNVVDDLAAHATAMPAAGFELGQLQTNLENDARANLAALVPESDRAALRAHLDIAVSAAPAQAILAYARACAIDLIVVGTHGREGLARLMLGSVAQEVARLARCPVLTVRAHAHDFVQPDIDRQAAAR